MKIYGCPVSIPWYRLNYYLAISIAFILPLSKRAIPPLIACWVITRLFECRIKKYFSGMGNKLVFILCLLFYGLHVIGLIHSSNIAGGLFDLEVKFSMLLFPLLFAGVNSSYETGSEKILLSFVCGNMLASITCLAHSIYILIGYHADIEELYYTHLSLFLHPSYFAMYLNFSVFIVLYLLDKKKRYTRKRILFAGSFFILVFIIMIYMLYSKAGIITICVTLLLYSLYKSFRLKNVLLKLALVISIISVSTYAYKSNFRFIQVENLFRDIVSDHEIDNNSGESTVTRYLVLKTAYPIIKNNFLTGVGTGDVKDVLVEGYEENQITAAIQQRLNAHNQFIETFIGLGVGGFLMLLLIFLIPLIEAVRRKKFLLFFFLIITGMNFSLESMLNTQAGVVYFAFFYSLLLFTPRGSYLS